MDAGWALQSALLYVGGSQIPNATDKAFDFDYPVGDRGGDHRVLVSAQENGCRAALDSQGGERCSRSVSGVSRQLGVFGEDDSRV